ncbi:Na+/H+ antiporter subunit D [Natronogracilivirga saccharolytica]|uniref:Na+/H+ antiporter subunit D n=1 Tax=Natronogracilivirga saccharolytica TaxID=2812953 RepID=A0A8J7UTT4_9BACT|nr:Na+/H+ antiporter subunit D [Natronogracilivirga saccharolytica]MBP3191690.1 Na+/H+ antiporter subunit D [Natronogracilivirga saccharolytica]
MNTLLVLPVAIPLITATIALLFRNHASLQRWVGVLGMVVLLGSVMVLFRDVYVDGIQVLQLGDWEAPFGITLVADMLSMLMLGISAIMGLVIAVYSLYDIDKERERFGYYPLLHVLLMGVNGSFLTGDIFNLYVWFEVMLIASFILLALGNSKNQLQGALKYVVINLFSSLIFLFGVAMLYGMTGTLNMADLAVRLPEVENVGLVTTVAMIFMLSFGIKAAIFPLFFWLPASYHTPPVAISAVFGGLLTKVGVYALIRVFTLLFTQDIGYTHDILLWVAGFTMVTGVLGAASHYEFRKILSFHIVSQIGYMIMGLAFNTALGLMGAIFYVLHNILAKSNLFLISGISQRLLGTFELKQMGGLYRHYPFLAVLFLVSAFALAGFPPLSGFWAKLSLVKAGLSIEMYLITAVAILVDLLTLFSMIKIWMTAFWGTVPEEGVPEHFGKMPLFGAGSLYIMVLPVMAVAGLILLVGLYAQPLLEVCLMAAEQLLDPNVYIEAVMGPQ